VAAVFSCETEGTAQYFGEMRNSPTGIPRPILLCSGKGQTRKIRRAGEDISRHLKTEPGTLSDSRSGPSRKRQPFLNPAHQVQNHQIASDVLLHFWWNFHLQ